jgi:hypothetical protein
MVNARQEPNNIRNQRGQ